MQLVLALLSAGSSANLLAGPQNTSQDHQHAGPVPREILDRPVALRSGVGSVHQKVSTGSQEAQAFYDQGLAYVNSYVWIEAIRSFHQALRADPNLGMAFLGLTDAYIGLQDVATARATLERAKTLEKRMNASERGWLNIREREVELCEDPNDPDKYAAYRRAINDELKRDPNDPWLWIQRGLADEGSPMTHGQAGGADTLAFYRTAMALAPDNSAAHHYYAHSLENLRKAKEALAETTRYLRVAPAIPHAHHMQGHELMRLGRAEEAIAEFQKAKALEEDYYRAEKIPAQYDWHHAHNLQLLAMSYQALGQMKAAEAAFKEAFAVPAYTDFLEYNRRAWPEFLLSRGRYAEALEAAQQLTQSRWPLPRLAGHTLAGEALLGLRRMSEAQDELLRAERETEQIPVNLVAMSPFPGVLRASLLLKQGNTAEAEPLLEEMVSMTLGRSGPDAWSAARFELDWLGRIARENGDWKLSQAVARRNVEHDPAYAGGYYALGLAAENAGDTQRAREYFVSAQKAWSKADSDLPELRHIDERLAANR